MKKIQSFADQMVRFMLLACGLMMLAGAVACLVMGAVTLAVGCCIVSAIALGLYLDAVLTALFAELGRRNPSVTGDAEEGQPPN